MSAEYPNGGPAFPGGELRFDDGDCKTPYNAGMSLRDWLAGQVIMGIGTWIPDHRVENLLSDAALNGRAKFAYAQADAMLKAREGN